MRINCFNYIGPCPTPYESVAEGCYLLNTTYSSWQTSREICQSTGGDLAVLDDCSALAPIIDFIQEEGY